MMAVVTVLPADAGGAAAGADAAVGRVAFVLVLTQAATPALDGEHDHKHHLLMKIEVKLLKQIFGLTLAHSI